MATLGRYPKGVAKRAEILETALALVARQGFRQTSVRDIADAVGLTPAGLLHYFESKDDLWVAILRKRDELDASPGPADPDPAGTLAAVVGHNAEVPGLVQMFSNLSAAAATDPEHPAHEYFRERYESVRATLAAGLGRMQASGRLEATVDPEVLASILMAVSDGMQLQWMFDDSRDMGAHVEAVIALARAGNRPPTANGSPS
ncbi:TetR/AcrR family transcriptional regulator [Cryobacterium sp.]|jgi:AcrR family transcriptional regulator|uniref:TetR/AcrR family transcriptional regulator n=1 Tax=Cryobacterium sp. TaxID=1926290 RepID=UPI00260A6A49|nr:TetR/AcrR family transcriptional regulator [Cryobacterium sp.]MCU1444563.1 TetR family transcriptional regulator [Cryobacterium sp.]